MKIYLGLPGNESLITNKDRDFSEPKKEVYEDVICEDGSAKRYTTNTVKHTFNFKYSLITKADLDVIETEYNRHITLILLVEKDIDSETYDNYNVLFDGELDKGIYRDWPDGRIYKNVSFTLKEI